MNTSGDGFLAMFDGPQRAIRCAMAIRDAVQALGIEVRAGLHTGECEVRGDASAGSPCTSAPGERTGGPNDVLEASTLRDLVIGSGWSSTSAASWLKGVPGNWTLFRVTASTAADSVAQTALQSAKWSSMMPSQTCAESMATFSLMKACWVPV